MNFQFLSIKSRYLFVSTSLAIWSGMAPVSVRAEEVENQEKGFPGEFPPVRINFWDTTGHWGVVELDEFATDINLQRTWWANGVRYTSGNDIVLANLPDGTPFFFQASSDISDCIAAWSWIGAPPVEFYIPFDGTEVEAEFEVLDIPDNDDSERLIMDFYIWVARDLTQPSEVILANSSLVRGLPGFLQIEYMEGNRFFGNPPLQAQSPIGNFTTAAFSQQQCDEFPSLEFCYADEAPLGPMRITFSVEGYTSDSVAVNAENLKQYVFNFLVTPLPNSDVATTPPQFGTGAIFPEEDDYPTSSSCIPVGILRAATNRHVNAWIMNGKEAGL